MKWKDLAYLDKAIIILLIYCISTAIYAFIHRHGSTSFLYSFINTLIFVPFAKWYDRKYKVPKHLINLFFILGILHASSITIDINGIRLTDTHFFGLFRMDQVVHTFSGILIPFVFYHPLKKRIDPTKDKVFFYAILIFSGVGIAAMGEIFELFEVVFLGQGEAVGNYLNNMTDIFLNFSGTLIAAAIFFYQERRAEKNFKFEEDNGVKLQLE